MESRVGTEKRRQRIGNRHRRENGRGKGRDDGSEVATEGWRDVEGRQGERDGDRS